MNRGASVKKMRTVYPSLTYPIHTTLITGRRPADHGIIHNLKYEPKRLPMDWYWYESDIIGDTLFKACKRENLTTGAVLWPVSAKGQIDFNIAEIIPHRNWHNQVIVSLLNSSPLYLLKMNGKYGHLRKGIEQPQLDDFVEQVTIDTIRQRITDLLAIHLLEVDMVKHLWGTDASETKEAIRRIGERVERIANAIEETYGWDNANLVVLSDHSQIDLNHPIFINRFLLEKGYLTVDSGVVQDYSIFGHSCEGSCYIYAKDSISDREIEALLDELAKNHGGIEKVYHHNEMVQEGCGSQARFMVEGKSGTYFVDDVAPESYHHAQRANHGYHPDKKDYGALFFGMGSDFKTGYVRESGDVLDVCATLSKLLNVEVNGDSGAIMVDLLK